MKLLFRRGVEDSHHFRDSVNKRLTTFQNRANAIVNVTVVTNSQLLALLLSLRLLLGSRVSFGTLIARDVFCFHLSGWGASREKEKPSPLQNGFYGGSGTKVGNLRVDMRSAITDVS
ncbi:MAG: hypothetical protein R3C18_01585 [Planctomycetaceae bacterium]